ncbi:MAG: permease [Paenibacillaceae bacterium]|jgi:sporulation integral membrane protein YtvI|nr:permease [Paenibacillaceae bacterium]
MERTLLSQLLRGLWVAVVLVAVIYAVIFITPLVIPFLIGWLIAYLLNPLVNFFQNKVKVPRWLAVTFSLLIFLCISGGLITLAVTNIVLEINDLSIIIQNNLNQWKANFTDYINSDYIQNLINRVIHIYNENPVYKDTINSNLTNSGKTVTDFVSYLVKFILDSIVVLLTSLPTLATVIIVALLAAFFISNDWKKLKGKLEKWTPGFIARPTAIIWSNLQKALFGYLRAQLILISITALFVIIGLLILRVEYAITIGLLIGLVDLMPYLGTGAVMVPWIIFAFIQNNYYLGIGLSILYGIILVARQILEPKVLATSIGLDALPTLISMYVGLKLFGFMGLIIGPVSLILLMTFYRSGVFNDVWRYIRVGRLKP